MPQRNPESIKCCVSWKNSIFMLKKYQHRLGDALLITSCVIMAWWNIRDRSLLISTMKTLTVKSSG
jgi:hypothetical protein